MDEEDGRQGARARQSGHLDARRGILPYSLCRADSNSHSLRDRSLPQPVFRFFQSLRL